MNNLNMNSELKLFKEGRPFGESLNLLKRMTGLVASDLHILPEEVLLNYESSILLYMAMYDDLKKKGLKLTDKDLKIFYSLPLFLPKNFVAEWENKKIWNNGSLDYDVVSLYSELLEGSTPSQAYVPLQNEWYISIWNSFFRKNEDIIKNILMYSFNTFRDYKAKRPVSFKDEQYNNINKICALINSKDAGMLSWISALFNFKLPHTTELISRVIELSDYNACKVFSTLNDITQFFNFNESNIFDILDEDSLLVKSGILKELKINNRDYDIYCKDKKAAVFLWGLLAGNNLTEIGSKPCDNIINNIVDTYDMNKEHINVLPTNSWDYLPIIEECAFKLKKGDSLKLLLTGKNGTGKSSIALSLLKENGLNVFYINRNDSKKENLKSILNILAFIDKSSIIIEDLNDIDSQVIKESKIPVIVINNDNIDVEIKGKIVFDYIVDTSDIPFKLRLSYAKSKINSENLAIRVAQQIKNFSDINKISRLVSSEEEWDKMNNHIITYDSRRNDFCEIINNEKIKDVPDFVGYESVYNYFNIIYDFFKNPIKYENLSVNAPKGFIISGLPGTGKTLFVQNVAKKIKLPLLSVRSSILIKNPEKIREVFDLARMSAPCILFFDEIDTLLIDPNGNMGSVDTEKQNILNSMLTEMDGVNGLSGVMILGTTNNSNKISNAAKRSGRLSETIEIDIPNFDDRKAIWSKYLNDKNIESESYIESLASSTLGFTGADISEIVNQACLYAINKNKETPDFGDIDRACEVVLWGRGNERIKMDADSIFKVAVHETGHALLAFKNGKEVNRVTIIPRQNALGITHVISDENVLSETLNSLKGNIEILLGGILAEKVIFGEYESGGTSDLKRVSSIVDISFMRCGFSKTIGLMSGDDKNAWSEIKKQNYEKECFEFVSEIAKETEDWLLKNKELLNRCSQELNKQKSLSFSDIKHWKEDVKNSLKRGNHE